MRSRTLKRALAVPAGVVLLGSALTVGAVAMAGSSSKSSPVDERSDAPASVAAAPTGPADLFQWHLQAGLSTSDISDAIEEQIAVCMREQGFEYEVVHSVPTEPLERSALREFRAKNGYGVNVDPVVLDDVNLTYRLGLDDESGAAYDRAHDGAAATGAGGEPDGCFGDALATLSATIPILQTGSADVVNELARANTNRISLAADAYNACMKPQGYDVYAAGDMLAYAEKLPSLDEEIKMAMIDLDCQSTTLWVAWDELSAGLADQLAQL